PTTDSRRVLYVNFDGANITNADLHAWAGTDWDVEGTASNPNLDLNRDGIVVQPFLKGVANREAGLAQVLTLLQEAFGEFGVQIQRISGLAVTGLKATTLFVGPAAVDGESSLRGISSDVDFGNDNRTDVCFAFGNYSGTNAEVAQFTANTAAHEVGHTLGLAHVDNLGLNELMRVGSLASDDQNARNNYTFLDRYFDRVESGTTGLVYPKDSTGKRLQQNSYKTLWANLGFTGPVFAGPGGSAVSDAAPGETTSWGGCGCPLCRLAAAGTAQSAAPAGAAPTGSPRAVTLPTPGLDAILGNSGQDVTAQNARANSPPAENRLPAGSPISRQEVAALAVLRRGSDRAESAEGSAQRLKRAAAIQDAALLLLMAGADRDGDWWNAAAPG